MSYFLPQCHCSSRSHLITNQSQTCLPHYQLFITPLLAPFNALCSEAATFISTPNCVQSTFIFLKKKKKKEKIWIYCIYLKEKKKAYFIYFFQRFLELLLRSLQVEIFRRNGATDSSVQSITNPAITTGLGKCYSINTKQLPNPQMFLKSHKGNYDAP